MILTPEKQHGLLRVTVVGRLDASWSDFFTETMLRHVREGEHRIVFLAAGLEYLSSAGIRALLMLHKELHTVNGSFSLAEAPDLIRRTLAATGFGSWLGHDAAMPSAPEQTDADHFRLAAAAGFTLIAVDAWTP